MTSSFAAQNRGSQNAHQNPVKSHKGGYLRCPFNISGTYAALAERRVREDLARGSSARGGAAVADKDGLLASTSSIGGHNDDGLEGVEGRPWSRAGVGANKLTGKEKRTQQEQAELIYGRGPATGGDGEEGTSSSGGGSGSVGHGPSQEHMFAVDTREQTALQQVVPRAVREKVKKRRFEELRAGRTQLGHHTPPHLRGEMVGGAAGQARAEEDEDSREAETLSKAAVVSAVAMKNTAPNHHAKTVTSASSASASSPTSSTNGPAHSQSPRQSTNGAPSGVAPQQPPPKPMNRMQMLNAMRASALTGKKRKR